MEFYASCESDVQQRSKIKINSLSTMSATMTRHENQVNFDHPHKKTSQSIPTLKTSHFQVIFSPYTKTKSNSSPTRNPSQFRSIHKNQVIFGSHTKQSQFRPPAQKPGQFRPPHSNKVNFDPPHKNQVHFDPNTEIESISMARHKTK